MKKPKLHKKRLLQADFVRKAGPHTAVKRNTRRDQKRRAIQDY